MDQQVVGVIEFFTDAELEPDATTLETMKQLALLVGRVVERDQGQRELGHRIAQLEKINSERALLASVDQALNTSELDYEATFERVVRLAIPQLADWCSVSVLDRSTEMVRRVAVAHRDPEKEQLAARFEHRYPLYDGGEPFGARLVLQTGEPLLQKNVHRELRKTEPLDSIKADLLDGLGVESAMIVPLEAHGEIFGVISFVRSSAGRVYEDEDMAIAMQIGRRAAQAIERARLYADARAAEERYRSLVEHMPAVAYARNAWPDLTLTYISPQIERLLGASVESCLQPESWQDRMLEEDWLVFERAQAQMQREGGRLQLEYRVYDAGGNVRWLRDEAVLVPAGKDSAAFSEGVLIDVTERKQLESELRFQALHDTLTELPNRMLFFERIEHARKRARRSDDGFAILFLDLDNFKVVNDSLGHTVGDQLLVAVAERLESLVRAEDTVARFGGDEFAILLEGVRNSRDVVQVAKDLLAAFQSPFSIGRREIFVPPSIGIVVAGNDERDPETLVRDADTAMYRAKRRGRARYELFEPALQTRAYQRLELENDLRRAIAENEFVLHYQPLYNMATGALYGVEALLRWQHPIHGLIPPQDVIPIAEETGLIVSLGRWILREACRQLRSWQEFEPELSGIRMSVNVSARQFSESNLIEDVRVAIEESGIGVGQLVLEITETAMMESHEEAAVTLNALRSMGVRINVDDFGTGYSTLSVLKMLPVDGLKIDRSFVNGLPDNPTDTVLVSGIIGLARAHELSIVAEGVESHAQTLHLQDLGCDLAQGYLFCPPVPAWQLPARARKATMPRTSQLPAREIAFQSLPGLAGAKRYPAG
ncbi:MAG: EAL domain-containing protein [Thermomicrobiales bacterium]